MRRASALALFASAFLPASLIAQAVQPPKFEIATDDKFEADEVPAYAGSHDDIYAYIDGHVEKHVEELQRWVRQRSISAQNDGIGEMAEMVRGDLESLGFAEAELVPTEGHPGVWGYYDAGVDKTLMLYMMYDVQPVEAADWRTPPFAGNVVETDHGKVLMARGATNQKGPERALLNAIEAVIEVTGTLPVNLMVTAEGEEELGSPHYPQIIDRYEQRLRTADGVFFPFNSQTPEGNTDLALGVKGILYLEMEATGGPQGGPKAHEVHGSLKALVDSPVWRLLHALGTMTSADGNTILIPGYYDDVRAPTLEEQRLINGMLDDWNEAELKEVLQVDEFIDGLEGREAILRYLYMPTLNIDGIWSGYTGEGVKTILPHKATAKVDSRLPPNMDPDDALRMIREFLDEKGFADIEIRKLSGYPPAQTSVQTPLVQAAISVINKYSEPPSVSPRIAGSAPFYQFTERLDLPLVFAGLGHGSGAHGPDEYMVIYPKDGSKVLGLADIEKAYVDLLYALAGDSSR
ncbi:MAG: M20/M25/M40 family metallo-hydrolase [Gammaproteobacteria bacterium]